MRRNNRGDQLIVLAILLIGLAGVLYLQFPEFGGWLDLRREVREAKVNPPPPAVVAQAQPDKPVEEVHESPDTETPLEHLIPRSSVGHSQGLHKVADPLKLDSSAAIVVDAQTKEAIFGKNPDSELPMASITKLMTGLLIVEAKLPMDEPITITEDDVDRERNSRSRVRVGTVLTRGDALHLALMSSENRAAHALGRTYPGGLSVFVDAMNRKAKQLGMTHTQYVEPTGLSEKNHSTARDLATLVLAASAYPTLREFSTTPQLQATIGRRALLYRNSDPLVRDSSWDIELQKTGYIIEAGHCVVMRTKVGTRDVVLVVLDAGSNSTRSRDARRLHQWVAYGADENAYKLALSAPVPRAQPAAKKAAPAKKTAIAAAGRSAKAAKQQDTKQARTTPKKKESTQAKAVTRKGSRVKAEFQAHKSKKAGDES